MLSSLILIIETFLFFEARLGWRQVIQWLILCPTLLRRQNIQINVGFFFLVFFCRTTVRWTETRAWSLLVNTPCYSSVSSFICTASQGKRWDGLGTACSAEHCQEYIFFPFIIYFPSCHSLLNKINLYLSPACFLSSENKGTDNPSCIKYTWAGTNKAEVLQ